jgi:hypothetical protein
MFGIVVFVSSPDTLTGVVATGRHTGGREPTRTNIRPRLSISLWTPDVAGVEL